MSENITLEDVCFYYRETGFRIGGITLSLLQGQIAVVTGPNGSGKTTLSKMIMGILKAEKGIISIAGQDIRKLELAGVAKKIGYLFQNPDRHLFCSSVLEEIKFSLWARGMVEKKTDSSAWELLRCFSMGDRADNFPLKLSRGERKRLALLAVFALDTPYYLLDEPSSGIDEENKKMLIDMLGERKKQGAGFCIMTHDRALIDLADRVITMNAGRIISDEKT